MRSPRPVGVSFNKMSDNFSLSQHHDKLKLIGHQTDPVLQRPTQNFQVNETRTARGLPGEILSLLSALMKYFLSNRFSRFACSPTFSQMVKKTAASARRSPGRTTLLSIAANMSERWISPRPAPNFLAKR